MELASLSRPCAGLSLGRPLLQVCSLRQSNWKALEPTQWQQRRKGRSSVVRCVSTKSSESAKPDDMSYLNMWRRAKEREAQQAKEKVQQQEVVASEEEANRRRQEQLASLLSVPADERDRVQKQLVLDRAAAAIAAAEAAIAAAKEGRRGLDADNRDRATAYRPRRVFSSQQTLDLPTQEDTRTSSNPQASTSYGKWVDSKSTSPAATPGPDFWTWVPPEEPQRLAKKKEKTRSVETLVVDRPQAQALNLTLQSEVMGSMPKLPPLQSLLDIQGLMQSQGVESGEHTKELPEESQAMPMPEVESLGDAQSGTEPDGARWWKESGTEERANGEVCTWNVVRGVTADGSVEWESKWWEVSDEFDYKEMGAEKSGRDANGGVWRETWREAMWQDPNTGLPHIEKSADKWARAADQSEWHEKWWEHYDATGRASKSADKWGKLVPGVTPEPGHANVWHERWGEEYDGAGGAIKWTDRWAERFEEYGGVTKWGDKWDERFDRYAQGRKSGETWWQGEGGGTFSKAWGEEHFGNGTVHKYGHSTAGEHWDVNEQMDTWYTPRPHFGFQDCVNQSYKLRQVAPPKKKGSSNDKAL